MQQKDGYRRGEIGKGIEKIGFWEDDCKKSLDREENGEDWGDRISLTDLNRYVRG